MEHDLYKLLLQILQNQEDLSAAIFAIGKKVDPEKFKTEGDDVGETKTQVQKER